MAFLPSKGFDEEAQTSNTGKPSSVAGVLVVKAACPLLS